MTRHWSNEKERSNPFSLKLICWIALHVSRPFARFWLYPITLYYLITSPRSRSASRKFLKKVPGYTGSLWQVAKHIHCFASTILDRVYFLTDQYQRFDIETIGREQLDQLLQRNQGCILLGAHIGSFEVLRCLAIKRDHVPLKIMMYRDHNAMITRVLDELNPSIADSVIDLADRNALLQMKEVIDKGELIGMLGDRHHDNEKYISSSLLGSQINMSSGAATLACVLKVPVVMFFGIHLGGNRYKIIFKPLTDAVTVARSERDQLVAKLTQSYVETMEDIIRQYPYNWFNFYNYWEDNK